MSKFNQLHSYNFFTATPTGTEVKNKWRLDFSPSLPSNLDFYRFGDLQWQKWWFWKNFFATKRFLSFFWITRLPDIFQFPPPLAPLKKTLFMIPLQTLLRIFLLLQHLQKYVYCPPIHQTIFPMIFLYLELIHYSSKTPF